MFHIEIRVPSDWVGQAGLIASFVLSDVRDLQESYSLLELFRAAPGLLLHVCRQQLQRAPRPTGAPFSQTQPGTAGTVWVSVEVAQQAVQQVVLLYAGGIINLPTR